MVFTRFQLLVFLLCHTVGSPRWHSLVGIRLHLSAAKDIPGLLITVLKVFIRRFSVAGQSQFSSTLVCCLFFFFFFFFF